MGQLENKSAIVTGGGTGIGLAISERFAAEGCTVMICGRREQKLKQAVERIEAAGGRVHYQVADVTVAGDVRRLVRSTREALGSIDILINNAGIMRFAPMMDTEEALWDQLMRTNAYAPWRLMVEVIPVMREQGGGSIVNLSSIAGHKPLPGAGAYCTSKAALQMLSQVMALEVAEHRIRINMICPGLVEETELADPIYGKEHVEEQFYAKLRSLHPLGRSGRPKDVADAALFFASEQSEWISGVLLPLDGGRHMASNRPKI